MDKYYRVIKDTPLWEVGAIIKLDDMIYSAIEDIWTKHVIKDKEGKEKEVIEYATVVENSPHFFERVYKSKSDKLIFVTKEKLKEAYKSFIK